MNKAEFKLILFICYRMDGPKVEFRWDEIFRAVHTGPEAYLYPRHNGYRVILVGKAAGARCWPPTFL
jgi:hypothetical protein